MVARYAKLTPMMTGRPDPTLFFNVNKLQKRRHRSDDQRALYKDDLILR